MADTYKPTNDEIVKMLNQIVSELADVKSAQKQLATDVAQLVKSS